MQAVHEESADLETFFKTFKNFQKIYAPEVKFPVRWCFVGEMNGKIGGLEGRRKALPAGRAFGVCVNGWLGSKRIRNERTRSKCVTKPTGHEPARCRWQMKRRRSVCRGLCATQAFAPGRTQGTANGCCQRKLTEGFHTQAV